MHTLDLHSKLLIIKEATYEDAVILNMNYKNLAYDTIDPKQQQEFSILRDTVKVKLNVMYGTISLSD
jgi:hypothetical protein